ncbi:MULTISPECIES: DUF4163 domain-containing protein [Lacrimispora]|uniref:DUF4163 domain-containing protein n=1 Tax=Lacrimispora TaxID=2719231 RepID=UPI000BE2BC6E|nr:DUF4163 domain-containing protein [Lacrimispora amygdalina]MDK2964888.1 hypothetical protein [Lacrimispora sp.]
MIITKHHILLIAALLSALTLYGCSHRNYVKPDLSGIQTTGSSAAENLTTTAIEVNNEPESSSLSTDTKSGIATAVYIFKNDKVTIEYPVLTQLEDESKLEAVNALLKNNALEIINAYSIDPAKDSLTVSADIISADRNRVSVVYTGMLSVDGAAHPTNLYYTSVVDLKTLQNIRLSDYVDPKLLAQYVLSDQCKFYQTSAELTSVLMDARTSMDSGTYTSIFQDADFSSGQSQKENSVFPESFSYEDKGTIIVSIPLPHALGDFALIEYTPETK